MKKKRACNQEGGSMLWQECMDALTNPLTILLHIRSALSVSYTLVELGLLLIVKG